MSPGNAAVIGRTDVASVRRSVTSTCADGSGVQPGHPVDDRAEVVTVSFLGLAGVQAHADRDRTGGRPVSRGECLLGGKGRIYRLARGFERDAELVAYRLEYITAGGGGADDVVVLAEGDGHCAGLGLP